MRIFLLFLSSLIFSIQGFSQSEQPGFLGQTESWNQYDTNPIRRHGFSLDMPKGYISGIMVTSEDEAGISGSLVNEFGISALDFRYDKSKNKLKLLNIASFLNKWYIKKVLKEDLKYCLHTLYNIPCKSNGRYALTQEYETIKIENKKYKLTYTFSPFVTLETDQNATQE